MSRQSPEMSLASFPPPPPLPPPPLPAPPPMPPARDEVMYAVSLGARVATTRVAAGCAPRSATTVLRPMVPTSRCCCWSFPVAANLAHSPVITSSDARSLAPFTRGGRHLMAKLDTSPLWSSSCLSTTAHTFFSTSGAARKVSLVSSASRSEVAMYRKSLSLDAIFSRIIPSAADPVVAMMTRRGCLRGLRPGARDGWMFALS
mmetsp:Transcript_23822/g.59055  ORF Transcript_23822/g.59055 Transcript_23822/m.59055 type:complete len:203 (+) Transcript_23822:1101-1709(+)